MSLLRLALILSLAASYAVSGQSGYPEYYGEPAYLNQSGSSESMISSQPVSSGISIYLSQTPLSQTSLSRTPVLSGSDECLTPASGHYGPRDMQVSQTGPGEFKTRIPNLLYDSGQVYSDGTYSSYVNVGSSGGANAQALLSFDISSIPQDASIRSVSLQFEGWDMVGSPFSKMGCLNIFPTTYRLLGSNSYSSLVFAPPCLKVCSSAQLVSPLSSPELTKTLQSALGQEKFQLRLQFEEEATGLQSPGFNRVYTISGGSSSDDDLSTGTVRRYVSSGYSGDYLSPDTSYDQQTMQDMGFDRSFLQSELYGKGEDRPGYILLPSGFNLTELGITPEMLEKAIDPSRVRISRQYEGADCLKDDVWGHMHCPEGVGSCYCVVGGGTRTCPDGTVVGENQSCPPVGPTYQDTGCPDGYCMDSNNDGICDSSDSIDIYYFNQFSGEQWGNQFASTSCCPDFNNDGYCDYPERPQPQKSCDLMKIGVAWLAVTYSQQVLTECDQASCQAQSKPTGQPYARGGRMYQQFNECGCAGGECQCTGTERDIGPACDQASCQARNRAIGSAYSRGGKIYQEVQECNCAENECRCAKVEKFIGIGQKPPLLPPPVIVCPEGNVTFKLPEKETIIETSRWGEVPVNQVLVCLRNGSTIDDLEMLLSSLGGQIVGYDESIRLYQIETSGKTEADLIEAISRAKSDAGVALAFPNQQLYLYQSPLDDPIYGGNRGRSQDIVGVKEAWKLIQDANLTLHEVRVAVPDDGLYRGFGEFNDTTHIVTDNASELKTPLKERDHCPWAGSHGTGVMNVLAADPKDGGLVGIASEPLRSNLTVLVYNYTLPGYYKVTGSGPFTQALLTLDLGDDANATIFSISWGTQEADFGMVQAYKAKMTQWSKWQKHSANLLVCAVPDVRDPEDPTEDRSMNGSKCLAGGLDLPNIITVGSIRNNGSILSSCWGSPNYNVTLVAPGEEVIYYREKDVNAYRDRYFGGTSMAVPMVTAAAAMIRSLNNSLTAAEIKTVLVETARETVNVSGKEVPVKPELGGRVLAIDLAVKRVIEDQKNRTTGQ